MLDDVLVSVIREALGKPLHNAAARFNFPKQQTAAIRRDASAVGEAQVLGRRGELAGLPPDADGALETRISVG